MTFTTPFDSQITILERKSQRNSPDSEVIEAKLSAYRNAREVYQHFQSRLAHSVEIAERMGHVYRYGGQQYFAIPMIQWEALKLNSSLNGGAGGVK